MLMVTMEIFDRPMCCSSGVCGPQVDKSLVEFAAALKELSARGVAVQRYNPAQQYEAFVGNPAVVQTINDKGTGCLPLILLDGQIVHHGEYPDKKKLAALAGLEGGKEA